MNYYGNNDYRNYLAHYGRKGMKKGRHLPGTTWWKDLAGSVGSGLQNAKWRAEDTWNTKVTGADYKRNANFHSSVMQELKDNRNNPYVKEILLNRGEYRKEEDLESKNRRLYNNSLKGRAEIGTRFLRNSFKQGARKVSSLASSAINAGKKFVAGSARSISSITSSGVNAGKKFVSSLFGKKKPRSKTGSSNVGDIKPIEIKPIEIKEIKINENKIKEIKINENKIKEKKINENKIRKIK